MSSENKDWKLEEVLGRLKPEDGWEYQGSDVHIDFDRFVNRDLGLDLNLMEAFEYINRHK